jgi:hypothetical protein
MNWTTHANVQILEFLVVVSHFFKANDPFLDQELCDPESEALRSKGSITYGCKLSYRACI